MPSNGHARSKSLHGKPAPTAANQTTVKDCLYWPTSSALAAQKMKVRRSRSVKKVPTAKGKTTGSTTRLEVVATANDGEPTNLATRLEGYYLGDDDDDGVGGGLVCRSYDEIGASKRGGEKKKAKKNKQTSGGGDDVYLGDLLSYRYYREAQEVRKQEEEAKRERKEEEIRACRERRTDLKANKTSQLRSITISKNLDESTSAVDAKQDLWKMNRFSGVQAKISTFPPSKEERSAVDPENDTSRFKELDDSVGFSPPGKGVLLTRGFEPDLGQSKNVGAYEFLPSTNVSHF